MQKNISLKTKGLLAFSIIVWASAFVGIRAGLEEFTPGGLALLRYLIASFCMFLVSLFYMENHKIPWRDATLLLLVGAIGIGFYNFALNTGEQMIPSGPAGFITSQSPLITMLCSLVFLRERISKYAAFGVCLSILGVMLIAMGESQNLSWHVGILYILLATLASGLYSALQKPFLGKYSILASTSYVIWGGTVVLLVFTPELYHELPGISWHAIGICIYLGVFPAAIGYLAWSHVLAKMPVSLAANFLYLMPIVTTLMAWLYFGEFPTLLSLAGGLLALLGVWITIQLARDREPSVINAPSKP
jgi:drug/metabolite transporter (DMT)-like permease